MPPSHWLETARSRPVTRRTFGRGLAAWLAGTAAGQPAGSSAWRDGYLPVPNGRLAYRAAGRAGRPIVFVHGAWMSGRLFDEQLAALAPRHRPVAYDLRGHGRSAGDGGAHTVAQYADDLDAVLAVVAPGEPAVLVGWSMGALVVWEYLRRHGDARVAGTVVVAEPPAELTRPDWPHGTMDEAGLAAARAAIAADYPAAVRAFVPTLFWDVPPAGAAARVAAAMARVRPDVAGTLLADFARRDYRPLLPRVRVPTLLCFGRGDRSTPLAAGRYLAAALPRARLVVFGRSGHVPFLEEPARFARTVSAFAAGL